MSDELDAIRNSLLSDDPNVAFKALERIDQLNSRDRKILSAIWSKLLASEIPLQRICAIQGLVKTGIHSRNESASLLQALKDEDATVRSLAAAAFQDVDSGTVQSFLAELADLFNSSDDPVIRRNCIRALGLMGNAADKAVPTLRAAALDSNAKVRVAALQALDRIAASGGEVVATAISAMQDDDGWVRAVAIELAGNIGALPADGIKKIVEGLSDTAPQVQARAAKALASIGTPPEAVPTLAAALDDKANSGLRYHAVLALGSVRPPSKAAITALGKALSDSVSEIRARAQDILKRIGTPEALEEISRGSNEG